MSSLRGQVVVVTGAASGIGLATAQYLASRGALISLADVNGERLSEIAKELLPLYDTAATNSTPSPVFVKSLDVRSVKDVDDWIKATMTHFGKSTLAGAVNVAGVIGESSKKGGGSFREVPLDEWDFVMDVNVSGMRNSIRAQLPFMRKGDSERQMRGGGSIVNIGSIASQHGFANRPAYVSSKHAVLAMTRAVAVEEGINGIRCNCVAPGFIKTPATQGVLSDDTTKQRADVFSERASLGRAGDADEIASVIAFLLGEEASFISGALIPVDGGWISGL